MTVISKEDILNANLEEEASVLEIHNELVRRCSAEDPDGLKGWLKTQLGIGAREGRIGFYVDEFGAPDVREIEPDEAVALLEEPQVWSPQSDTMIHVYSLGDRGPHE